MNSINYTINPQFIEYLSECDFIEIVGTKRKEIIDRYVPIEHKHEVDDTYVMYLYCQNYLNYTYSGIDSYDGPALIFETTCTKTNDTTTIVFYVFDNMTFKKAVEILQLNHTNTTNCGRCCY